MLKQGYVELDRSASEEHGTRIAKSGSWRSTSVLIPGSACWHPQDLPKRSQVPHGENLPHRDQERTATVRAARRDAEASPPSLSSRLTTTKKQRSWKGYAPPSLRPEMGRGKEVHIRSEIQVHSWQVWVLRPESEQKTTVWLKSRKEHRRRQRLERKYQTPQVQTLLVPLSVLKSTSSFFFLLLFFLRSYETGRLSLKITLAFLTQCVPLNHICPLYELVLCVLLPFTSLSCKTCTCLLNPSSAS